MERKSFFHNVQRLGKWIIAHKMSASVVAIIIAVLSGCIHYITYEDEGENVVYIKPDIEKLTTMANEVYEKNSLKSIRTINNENEEYKFKINATTDSTRIEIYSKIDGSKLVKFFVDETDGKLKAKYVKREPIINTQTRMFSSMTIVFIVTVSMFTLLSVIALFYEVRRGR